MASAVCRVCLVANTRMLNIDSSHLLYTYEKLANTKLNTERDNGIPRTVCYVCHRQLQRCHRFSLMADKSNTILHNLLQIGAEVTHSAVTTLSLWEMHNLSVSPTQYTSMDSSDDKTSSDSDARCTPETVKQEQVVKEEINDADVADIKLERLDEYIEIEINNTKPLAVDHNAQDDPSYSQSCYYCDLCKKKIATKNQLIRHIKFHFKEKPYSCKKCQKRFSQKNSLPRHMRVHTGEKMYSCDRCDKKFNQKFALTSHMLVHTGEKPYSCNRCDKAFHRKDSLNTHLLVHTGEKPYCCNVCDKAFNHKNVFTRHMLVHIEKKPLPCNRCDKTFSRKDSLTNHMLVHSGERPYSCKICKKAFTRKDNLTKHLRVHSGEKPLSCDIIM